jgi:signal transduction histidine kinase
VTHGEFGRKAHVTPLRRALFVLGVAGFGLGILTFVVIVTGDHETERLLRAILSLLVAWSFVGTGLYAWDRRPDNLIGVLMVGVGFSWCLAQMVDSNIPALFAIGLLFNSVPIAFIFHMLVIFPSGRASSAFDRFIIVYSYLAACVVAAVPVFFYDPASDSDCAGCPSNPLVIVDNFDLVKGIYLSLSAVSAVVILLLAVHFFRRAKLAAGSDRGRDAPVWWAGGVTTFLFAALLLTNFGPEEGNYDDIVGYFAILALASVPYAFLAGLLRSKLTETEMENVRLDAELQARLDELRDSRARIVAAEASARRKLERDLHDGAQQRLVGLALDLRLARSKVQEDPEGAAALLDEAQAELGHATEELRELARGIHPAVLSDRGLEAAVDALATRAPMPVEVDARVDGRLPDAVEAAAYFVVAEALTNVARHAGADRAEVGIEQADGLLSVEVRDDGQGGADLAGSGLRGLADRVTALDGELEISSPRGRGTTVRATIPIGRNGA